MFIKAIPILFHPLVEKFKWNSFLYLDTLSCDRITIKIINWLSLCIVIFSLLWYKTLNFTWVSIKPHDYRIDIWKVALFKNNSIIPELTSIIKSKIMKVGDQKQSNWNLKVENFNILNEKWMTCNGHQRKW